MRKADSTLRSSRAVPHPSTNRALRRLTSEVRRDPVYSTRYGRQQIYLRASREPTTLARRADSQELFRPAFASHAIQAEEGMPQLQKDAQNLTRGSAARTCFANRCESPRIRRTDPRGPEWICANPADPLRGSARARGSARICCLCIRIVLYRFRFESRWRLVPTMDCQRLKLIGRQGEGTTGYSSVGRASDCRLLQKSDGPWFDSGWPVF